MREKIIVNKIQCKSCFDIIESESVHDFKYCSCKQCFVDGGKEYLRRGFGAVGFTELSQCEENTPAEMTVEMGDTTVMITTPLKKPSDDDCSS